MNMPDEFTAYYADLIDGTYDCVDRIVLNGYFRMGQSSGGFRMWWRSLNGTDNNLDTTHLMRMAGRLSRRVRAHAKAHRIPIIDCQQGERKHEIAEQHLPKEPDFVGVFLIMVSRAPAPVWDVQRSKNGKITNIVKKKNLPYVNHYLFHIIDPQWGHITIKLCGHPPFNAQIILNGHEYVARQSEKERIKFTKEGNCFTSVSDAAHLTKIADTLCSSDIIGRLSEVCERWIYSACLCFALDMDEQKQSGFHYSYFIYQGEYSRNLLFMRGSEMNQIFQGVIDRTRSHLGVKTLKTIFGTKKRPTWRKGQKEPRCEVAVERPVYDLTVFKIHFGKLTAKLYTKGECVLRIEIIVHNARVLPGSRSLEKFSVIVSQLKGILNRFLNAVGCIHVACIADTRLDDLSLPSCVGHMRVCGVDINKPRMRAVFEGIIELATSPLGFTTSALASKVKTIMRLNDGEYTPRQAAYDLKKLRGKNLVCKKEKSRRYEVVPEGLQIMVALLTLREKVIKPILAGVCKPKRGPKPKNLSRLDSHYQLLQGEMRNLFQTIGIAA